MSVIQAHTNDSFHSLIHGALKVALLCEVNVLERKTAM